jgi:hypothetical protein
MNRLGTEKERQRSMALIGIDYEDILAIGGGHHGQQRGDGRGADATLATSDEEDPLGHLRAMGGRTGSHVAAQRVELARHAGIRIAERAPT